MLVNNLFRVICSGSTATHEIKRMKCKQQSNVAHKFHYLLFTIFALWINLDVLNEYVEGGKTFICEYILLSFLLVIC